MRKMNKVFAAVLAAVMAFGVAASGTTVVKAADNVLDANTMTADAEYYEEKVIGNFTLVGNADKAIRMQTPGEGETLTTEDGKAITQFMKFDGGANQIKFAAKKGDKVVVYVMSGGSDERTLGLFTPTNVDDKGKAVALLTNPAPSTDGGKFAVANFEIPADGDYFIASVSKGIRVAYVSVGAAAASTTPKQDSVPKTGVVSVAAVCGVVALAGAGMAVVTGKKKEN